MSFFVSLLDFLIGSANEIFFLGDLLKESFDLDLCVILGDDGSLLFGDCSFLGEEGKSMNCYIFFLMNPI